MIPMPIYYPSIQLARTPPARQEIGGNNKILDLDGAVFERTGSVFLSAAVKLARSKRALETILQEKRQKRWH